MTCLLLEYKKYCQILVQKLSTYTNKSIYSSSRKGNFFCVFISCSKKETGNETKMERGIDPLLERFSMGTFFHFYSFLWMTAATDKVAEEHDKIIIETENYIEI